ncbi:UDP-glucose 4-epimerase GalE [bacterium]|nr:MAG: UDP-glucose 4-epimerase GalE [bacterium]
MKLLVTGGAGFIGSHAVLEFLLAGHDVLSLDNYSNSSPEALKRVAKLAGRAPEVLEGDLRDEALLLALMREKRFDAVVHFAGLKAVGESVEKPLIYVDNNIVGSAHLLKAMKDVGCKNLVFSSSCTVYGMPQKNPIGEDHPRSALNPYGRSKLVIEDMCFDLARSESGWHMALLRYFNPVGAHDSGDIGEDPRGIPNNLVPFVMQTAVGRHPHVNVWGKDYPTPDGTGIRDYIHVVDLAKAHLAAVERIASFNGAEPVNLGTGKGYSVLDVISAAGKAAGKDIPYKVGPRRAGDAPEVWGNPSLAAKKLGWTCEKGLGEMVADHWRWQKKNPEGYKAG